MIELAHGPIAKGRRTARLGPVSARATAFALLACWTLGGCRSGASPGTDVPTLTVLHPDAPDIFGAGWPAKFLVFLPLVVRTEAGEPEGRLLKSWEHSDDYREWTLHLRTGIEWEDGVPVTARDVAFSLELLAHPAVLMYEPGSFRVEVLDDSTYTIELLRPTTAGTARDFFMATYPKHLLDSLDPEQFYEWEFWSRPVGNGPYRVTRIVPHTAVELVARPEHYRGRPAIERVMLRLGHESGASFSTSAIPVLLGGEVDAISSVRPMDLLAIRGREEFASYYSFDHERTVGFFWNSRAPPFDDPVVRRALALAIDRGEILQAMNLPEGRPTIGSPVSDRQLQTGRIPPHSPFDPERARALLAEAGWVDLDGDGVRERAGVPLAMAVLVSEWQQTDRIGLLIQARLAEVGVRATLDTMEFASLRDRVLRGDFDAVVMNAFGQVAPWVLLGAGSPLGYGNAEVADVIALRRDAFDPALIDRLNVRLAELIRDDPPGVFLFNPVFSTIVRREVRGLSSPWREDPLAIADALWVGGDR